MSEAALANPPHRLGLAQPDPQGRRGAGRRPAPFPLASSSRPIRCWRWSGERGALREGRRDHDHQQGRGLVGGSADSCSGRSRADSPPTPSPRKPTARSARAVQRGVRQRSPSSGASRSCSARSAGLRSSCTKVSSQSAASLLRVSNDTLSFERGLRAFTAANFIGTSNG